MLALARALSLGTLLLVGGSTALSVSMFSNGKNRALPRGTVTVRVTSPPNVPGRKKNLLPGPMPCSWPAVACAPVVSSTGLVFVPPVSTAGWAYTHCHQRAVRLPYLPPS